MKEQAANTLSTSIQFNNCAMHLLAPYVTAFVSPRATQTTHFQFNEIRPSSEDRGLFRSTKGYHYFLKAFSEYYCLSQVDNLEKSIESLLEKYAHPLDLQVLLGPVLRLTLKRVLLDSKQHKDSLKESFHTLINACADRYREYLRESTPSDEHDVKAWLSTLHWSGSEEHEELLVPNKSIIAKLLYLNKTHDYEKHWNIAYNNYCDYQGDPAQCVYISESQLALICASLKFDFRYQISPGILSQSSISGFKPLATVLGINNSGTHWDLLATKENKWDQHCEEQSAHFQNYHDACLLISSQPLPFGRTFLVQNAFKRKIEAEILKGEVYQEDFYAIGVTENWSNNSGLEDIVTILSKVIIENNPALQGTTGYEDLLVAFREYYDLDRNLSSTAALESIKNLLKTYLLPQERFMLLSPVLRKMQTGDAHGRCLLNQEQLFDLCKKFNISIQEYFYRERSKVSCFESSYQYSEKNEFGKVALTRADTQWFQVFKNRDTEFEAKYTKAYSPNHAFAKLSPNVSHDLVALRRLQAGISTFLRTGILYDEVHEVISHDHPAGEWTPIHQGVYQNNIALVSRLLKEGANWRLPALMGNIDPQQSRGKSLYSPKMSALELAVVGSNRQMVALILQYASPGQDDELVQLAYNRACSRSVVNVLYAFQPYPNLAHSQLALRKAVQGKDLALFMMLREKGAPLLTSSEQHRSILKHSLDESKSNAAFGIALLNMTLLSWQRELMSKKLYRPDIFKLQEVDLKLVSEALASERPEWISHLIKYYSILPKLLKREKELTPIASENIFNILVLIAQDACAAISDSNINRLERSFKASTACLQIDGRWNLMHHALLLDKDSFLREGFANYFVDTSTAPADARPQVRKVALELFDSLADTSYDKFGRTYRYRLERANLKKQIHQDLKSSSLIRKYPYYVQLQMFGMTELRNRLFDVHLEKAQHNTKIQNNWISRLRYMAIPIVTAARNLSGIGMVQTGLSFAWTFAKIPVLNVVGNAGADIGSAFGFDRQMSKYCTLHATDALVGLSLMPEYYLASTVVDNGVYYAFKDKGYDNLESFTQVLLDGVTQSVLAGKNSNYVQDEKYHYNLDNNLTPFFGGFTPLVASAVSTIVDVSNQANTFVNKPFDGLRPYFSASVVEGFKSLPMFEPFRKVASVVGDVHVAHQRVFNLMEESLLGAMGDSVFKNERLHAIQMYETTLAYTKVYRLNQKLEESKAQMSALSDKLQNLSESEKALSLHELEAIQLNVAQLESTIASQQKLVDAEFKQEELLYQKTEGYRYKSEWEEKYYALKWAQNDKRLTSAQVSKLEEETNEAWKKCQFYNNDPTIKTAQQWGELVDEHFTASKDNFLDQTNIVDEINYIINVAFATSSDRNTIAHMIADGYILKNYPLYPGLGDKAQIEADRLIVYQKITNEKIKGYTHDPQKVKDRLYNYLLAKITSTPEKHHIPRHQRILKPFVNEILGKTIGFIPFPDFKGGRTGNGGSGLQVNKAYGQPMQAAITVAGEPIYNLRSGSKKGTLTFTMPKPEVKVPVVAVAKQAVSESATSGLTKIHMDSQYMQDILATQYKETLGAKIESVGKLPVLRIPEESVGKLPRTKLPANESVGKVPKAARNESNSKLPIARKESTVIDAEAKFSHIIPKVVIPGDTANWLKMATEAAQGKNNLELRLWQKHNVESKELPFLLKCLPKDIGNKIFPVADFMREVLVESWDEAKDAVKLMENLVFTEVDLALRGEEFQTVKAVKILGVFIGIEAARLALKEQTATSQYIKQVAADFMNMSDRDKAKAAAKIFAAYKLPALGMKLISKAGVVSVQKVCTKEATANKVVDKGTPIATAKLPEVVLEPKSFTPHYDLRTSPKFDTIRETINKPMVSPSKLSNTNVSKPYRPYAPDRKLPLKNGVGIPDPEAQGVAHTQLGKKHNREKNYSYTKARHFDENGIAVRDIEFTDHRRKDHTDPHQHPWVPNETGGTLKRGDPEPLPDLENTEITYSAVKSKPSK